MFNHRVQIATPADLEPLVAFSIALARKTERRRLDRTTVTSGISALLEGNGFGFVLVAKNGPEITAELIVGGREWSEWSNGEYWVITSFCCLPQHDMTVMARVLLNYVIDMAQSAVPKVIGVRANVLETNRFMHDLLPNVGLTSNGYLVYEQKFDKANCNT